MVWNLRFIDIFFSHDIIITRNKMIEAIALYMELTAINN